MHFKSYNITSQKKKHMGLFGCGRGSHNLLQIMFNLRLIGIEIKQLMSLIQVIDAVLAQHPVLSGHRARIVADVDGINKAGFHDVCNN